VGDARSRLQEALYFLNPSKFYACRFLKGVHEAKRHKIIIFCHSIDQANFYAEAFKCRKVGGGGGGSGGALCAGAQGRVATLGWLRLALRRSVVAS
jgi:hypothetical protein